MPVITIPLLDVKQMISALLPHTSSDMITPVLTHVVVGGDFGTFAYATDRYTIGRYDLTNVITSTKTPLLIPRAALTALRSVGKATLPYGIDLNLYAVRFAEAVTEKSGTHLTVSVVYIGDKDAGDQTHWMRVFLTSGAKGTFPPVGRFFDDFRPGKDAYFASTGDQLGKFAGYSKACREYVRVTHPEAGLKKPLPLLVEIGARFQGFLQPLVGLSDKPLYNSDKSDSEVKA